MNNIKNMATLILGGLVFLPSVSYADSGFIPRASLAISDYSFVQAERPNVLNPATAGGITEFPEVSFDVTFNMLGVGGTFYHDKYYVDLSAQHSDKQSDKFVFGAFEESLKGDRQDYAITFGMKPLDALSVYVGYKVGISEAAGNQGTKLKFTEDGYFVGANYSWPVYSGTITVNLAVAQLDGKFEETAAPATLGFSAIGALDLDADSKATGLSYGITWSAPLTERLVYALSLDVNNYTFDEVRDDVVNPPDEFEEEFTTARMTLSYYF